MARQSDSKSCTAFGKFRVDSKFLLCESDGALSLAFEPCEISHLSITLRRRTSVFTVKFYASSSQTSFSKLNEAAKKLRLQHSPVPSFFCQLGSSASNIGDRLL